MDRTIISALNMMLDLASGLDINPSLPKTFFDVAGYPHYENVASSILAFFFATDEEHGLKDLWLKSLLDCFSEKQRRLYIN